MILSEQWIYVLMMCTNDSVGVCPSTPRDPSKEHPHGFTMRCSNTGDSKNTNDLMKHIVFKEYIHFAPISASPLLFYCQSSCFFYWFVGFWIKLSSCTSLKPWYNLNKKQNNHQRTHKWCSVEIKAPSHINIQSLSLVSCLCFCFSFVSLLKGLQEGWGREEEEETSCSCARLFSLPWNSVLLAVFVSDNESDDDGGDARDNWGVCIEWKEKT